LEVGEETEKLKKRKINQLQHGSAWESEGAAASPAERLLSCAPSTTSSLSLT
jgi:hypothetical protein